MDIFKALSKRLPWQGLDPVPGCFSSNEFFVLWSKEENKFWTNKRKTKDIESTV